MGESPEIIINNILCFINSARDDFSKETLKDVCFSFYSHEDIKVAKQELCNLLKKDLVWRRDPEKKKKDLADVVDFHEELTSKRNKMKFVCSSYKGMPPVGMEMIGPLLINLSSEVGRINELLPKIVDIKSEVVNTADTVRQMKIEMTDIKDKFTSAVNGMNAATEEITDEDIDILRDLHSFRKSLSTSDKISLNLASEEVAATASSEDQQPVADVADGAKGENTMNLEDESLVVVSDPKTGAVSKNVKERQKAQLLYSDAVKSVSRKENLQQKHKNVTPRGSEHGSRGRGVQSRPRSDDGRLRGVRKDGGYSSFKAVKRTVDVFLGRVDKDTTIEVIQNYVKDTFNVVCLNIEKLNIKTDLYNAFKITVSLTDRETLFNSDLWPEGVIISKFYNRSKTYTLNK